MNLKVSNSLRFIDSHIVTCGPNQIIKIGAIVFEEDKEVTEGSAAVLDTEQRAQIMAGKDKPKIRFKVYEA